MHLSTLTIKGQTTVPQEIREYLHLLPQDKIVYVPDGDKVYITHVRGSILDLKAALRRRVKKPINFHKLRERVKEKVAKEALKESP
jgi:bifunctional DNA-binding transcriptional regulator/antitoxin component of YhaV-PrlF toxin-antitoxin module